MRDLPLLLGLLLLALPARATIEQDYLQIYLALNDAERLERAGDFKDALAGFETCYNRLRTIHTARPSWHDVLVTGRMEDCRAKVSELELQLSDGKSAAAATTPPANPSSSQPGANQPPFPHFTFTDFPRYVPTHSHPWKTSIATDVFILSDVSSTERWDTHWVRDNGGNDTVYEMSGYASANHASALNPFYVALPFNDLAHPDAARKWMPAGWISAAKTDPASNAKPASACQDRWIEIKNRYGRVCFAQWEAAAPEPADDALYVFGDDAVKPREKIGLRVSPAVAKYLGVDGTTFTSWRFVDDQDVLPGMWLRYDEQAILFTAMHQPVDSSSQANPATPPAKR